MSYGIRILLKARKEIIDSGEWYEEKQVGLRSRFEKAVIGKLAAVSNNPLHYPLKGKIREAITNDFPFILAFRIDEANKMVVVLSVFHMSRHPDKKLPK